MVSVGVAAPATTQQEETAIMIQHTVDGGVGEWAGGQAVVLLTPRVGGPPVARILAS